MADEKKKPDLKARLNRTVVGQATQGPSTPPDAATSTPPPGIDQGDLTPPPSATASVPGGDIAVPDFIKQQMAEKAAAEARVAAEARAAAEARVAAEARAAAAAKARAAAADPFAAADHSHAAAPQEIRIVVDDKAVSDAEVGRKNTGALIGIVVTGVVALSLGYFVGDYMEQRSEGARTVAAMTAVRTSVDQLGALVNTMKEKVDHAATAAGIQGNEGEGQAPAQAQAPQAATVDTELATWFAQQSPDPPLTPEAYAGRVGRLRAELVQKLMKVQFELDMAWRDLRRHQQITQGSLATIQSSLADAQRARGEFQRMMVVFQRGPQDGPAVMGTLVLTTPQGAAFNIAPVIGTPTRELYSSGDISQPTIIGTVGIPVSDRQGAAATAVRALGQPWTDYVTRLRSLKSTVDALASDHRSLADAINNTH